MIKISVTKSVVSVQETVPLYSGSVDTHTCQFTFDTSWERFGKSAVFRYNGKAMTAALDNDGCCLLPWELLVRKNIGLTIEVGVYGVSPDTEIMTSVWDNIGTVRDGTELGNDTKTPSPDVYEQIMSNVQGVDQKISDYSNEMMGYLQRAESAASVAADNSSRALGSANTATTAAGTATTAAGTATTAANRAEAAKSGILQSEKNAAQSASSASASATSAKVSADNAAQSATNAEASANRAQAEADRVTVPAAVGVYNVVLTDRVTNERYALIVENGRLALLGVSETLNAVNVNLIETATGTAYELIVESGRLNLKEV